MKHERLRSSANMDDVLTALPPFDMTQDGSNESDGEENLFVPR